jgi:hypothetical protein
MKNTDFTEIMAKRTDKELIIVAYLDRNDYQPLAVIAAEEEIKKRNISTTKIEQTLKKELRKREREDKEAEQEKKDKKESLKFQLIIWLVFIFIGVIIYLFQGDVLTLILFALTPPCFKLWLYS